MFENDIVLPHRTGAVCLNSGLVHQVRTWTDGGWGCEFQLLRFYMKRNAVPTP